MIKRLILFLITLLCAVSLPALDIDYSVSAAPALAAAFGTGTGTADADFLATAGGPAYSVPVFSAAFMAGADIGIAGPLRFFAGLEARRLGYALWAADSGSAMWVTLWEAGLRLGARWDKGAWYAGAGASLGAPISSIMQGSSQGSAGIKVAYDVSGGKVFAPGAYLEGGLPLGPRLDLGPLGLQPRLGIDAACWPGGFLDAGKTWQCALSLVVSLGVEWRKEK